MAADTGFGLPRESGGSGGRQTFVPSDSPFADVAALEAWAAANPSDLHNGTGDNNIVTVLVVTDNAGLSDTSSITYEWSGGDEPASYTPVTDRGFWIVHTALDAADVKSLYESNPDTNAYEDSDNVAVTSIQSLPLRSVPMATATGFSASSIEQMLDDSVMISESVRVQGDMGISLGPGVSMFDQGSQPGYQSGATGNRYTFILNQYLRQTGFVDPAFSMPVSEDTEPETFPFQVDFSQTLTNPSFSITNTDTRLLDELLFRAPSGVTNSNVCARIRSITNNNEDVLYLPNERDWLKVSEGDFTENPGFTFSGLGASDISLDVSASPVQTVSPEFSTVTYQVDFVSNGDLTLLGNSSGTPYFQGRGHAFEFKSLTEHIDDRVAEGVPERSRTIIKTASYTAEAADFVDVDHVFYRFNNSGQVDFTIPVSIVPDNISLSVKEVGIGGPTHRVLVQAQGGLIDGDIDHLLDQEQAILIHKGTSNTQLDIIANYEPGSSSNNYVTSGSFANNIISLNRIGLSSAEVPLDINDVNNVVSGLPVQSDLNLVAGSNTRQTINLGSLALDWSALSGGKVGIRLEFHAERTGGNLPIFRNLELNYGTGALILNFPLNVGGGTEIVREVDIPDTDYTAILNTEPVATLTVDVSGFLWDGYMEVRGMYNRLTSLIHEDVETISEQVFSEQIVPIQNEADINQAGVEANKRGIEQLVQEIDNLGNQIPADVLSWLINDVTIVDSNTPVLDASVYNRSLSQNDTQTVYVDAGQNNDGTDLLSSSMSSARVRGQKMLEIIQTYSDGDVIVEAGDGTPLLKRVDNSLIAVKFVPAHGGGTRTITHVPTPAHLVAHDWFDVAGHTPSFQSDVNELAFTNDNPASAVTLNIRYRYFSSGNPGPTITATLANVGGSTDQEYQADLALPTGESFHIIVQWRASDRVIEYQAIPRANNPDRFIFDTQVSLDWTETVTEPATPATTTDIRIGSATDGTIPLALFAPSITRTDSDAATMIIYGQEGQVDTLYPFNDLFGATDTGTLNAPATTEVSGWYEYEGFTPSGSLVQQFADRQRQAFFGWFVQNYNHETIAEISTQVQVKDAADNDVPAGVTVESGADAPTTAPSIVGVHFWVPSKSELYFSVGTSSASDWVLISS